MGGGVSIDGVEGTFSGKTMGGKLKLTNLKGELQLTTMGGSITLTNSDVDGRVKTMGGKALVENVCVDSRSHRWAARSPIAEWRVPMATRSAISANRHHGWRHQRIGGSFRS